MPTPTITLLFLAALSPVLSAVLAPTTITILSTNITNCAVPITVKPSLNNTSLDIFYDTSKATNSTPDTLASTNEFSVTETTCVVCMAVKWSNNLYGRVMSLDYDFEHRLDPGTLEQVFSTLKLDLNDATEEFFDTSYIYGGDDTSKTYRVHTNLPNATEALVLDYTKESESICSQSTFRVIGRGGAEGAFGELAKKSVFVQSLNVEWSQKL